TAWNRQTRVISCCSLSDVCYAVVLRAANRSVWTLGPARNQFTQKEQKGEANRCPHQRLGRIERLAFRVEIDPHHRRQNQRHRDRRILALHLRILALVSL